MSLKDAIQNHFGSDYTPFFHRFLEDLKPGGAGNLKALCPFHEDQTAYRADPGTLAILAW